MEFDSEMDKSFRNRKRVVFEPNRANVIRKLANRHRYDYTREERPPRDWHQLDIFRKNRRILRNRLRHIGPNYVTNIADFGYQSHNNDKHWQTVVVIEHYAAEHGRVLLRPISTDDGHSVDVVPSSQLTTRYTAHGDAELVSPLFDAVKFKLCLERNRGWTIEVFSRFICLYRPEFVVDAFAYHDYTMAACGINDLLMDALSPSSIANKSG